MIPHNDNNPLNETTAKMKALSFERANKYDIQVMKTLPDIWRFDDTIWLGSFSWSWANGTRKIIQSSYARYPFGVPQTPAELARDYLTIKFPEPLKAHKKQLDDWRENFRSAPLFADPCYLPDACYVDLKSAYWSILNLIGWDTEYSYKRFWGRGTQPLDFPFPDDKLTRNILVSAGVTGRVPMWYNRRILEVMRGNRLKNLGLWSAVNDILHFIAVHAVNACSAVYVHTDGYIVPRENAWELTSFIEDLGLSWGIKYQGDATIYGVGAYDIEGHTCAPQQRVTHEPFSNLVGRDPVFMVENLRYFKRVKDTAKPTRQDRAF